MLNNTLLHRVARSVVVAGCILTLGCGDDKKNEEGGDNSGTAAETADEDESEESAGDDGDVVCEIVCSPGLQNCPNDGEKCTPFLCHEGCCTDATHCVSKVAEPKQFGEDCTRDAATGNDDCDKQLFCMPTGKTTGESGPGKCERLCITRQEGKENHCKELGLDESYSCFNFNDGTFPVCLPACDPINPVCPDEKDDCYLAIDNYMCTPFGPTELSDGKYGDPCDTEQGCQPGMACADKTLLPNCEANCVGSAVCGCCAPFCDLTAVNPKEKCMDPAEECLPIFENPPPGKEHVGLCAIPR